MNKNHKHIELNSIDKNPPFKVPENYFETLNERIMDRVESESEIGTKIRFIRIIKPVLAVAASFALIFLMIYFPVKSIQPKMASQGIKSEQEFLDYYYYSDHIFMNTLETEVEEVDNEISTEDAVYETMLLASVSDLELLNYNN